jgi:hypothetical protein
VVRNTYLPCACLAIAVFVAAPPAPARAQTLKDSLKQHVREGVDRSKDKKEREREKDKARAAEAAAGTDGGAPSEPEAKEGVRDGGEPPAARDGVVFSIGGGSGSSEPEPEEPKPAGPKLPVRVLGKDLQLDFTLGLGYRGWLPQQYDLVSVDVASYLTWNIDVKAKLFGFLNLRRGYYESNGLSGPRTEEAAVAAQIGSFAPKAMWLLGVLGVPISKAWEPQVRYESRAFETRARADSEVCLVDRDAPEDAEEACPGRTMGELKVISSFETFVAGVRYDHNKTGSSVVTQKGDKFPPLFFGIGLMQYRKPYQLNIDGFELEQYLFNARFRGAGLALGAEFGGGLDRFFAEVDAQLGLGEVSLTNTITLNELVPNDELIGYVQGMATLGYRLPLIRAAPTLIFVPSVRAGGASFFLVETRGGEREAVSSPSVNWDFLWTVQAALLIPL